MANSLDPGQARHFVWPDLGPNCLQRLSADGAEFCHNHFILRDILLLSKVSKKLAKWIKTMMQKIIHWVKNGH